MKKIKYILPLLILLFLCGCTKDKSPVKELSYTKLNEKLENKEDFILMIGATSCTHCDKFKLTLAEVKKRYKVTFYYIDVDKLSSEEESKLKSNFPYTGTPTTVNIINGVEVNSQSRIDGSLDYGVVKKRLIKWGYIKEDTNE